ncbi:MAG: hypothetical protein AAF394_10685 [Planctomycetota bacterium]
MQGIVHYSELERLNLLGEIEGRIEKETVMRRVGASWFMLKFLRSKTDAVL